jgi:hypothetical protein
MYLAATDETLPASRRDKRLQVALPYHQDNDGCTARIHRYCVLVSSANDTTLDLLKYLYSNPK